MLKELREQQARIATNARAKFDEITDDTPAERAAEIEREFDAMMAEHDKIEAKIERAERLERAERAANAPDPRRPSGNSEARAVVDDNKPDYKTAFYSFLARGGDLGEMSAEERAILKAGHQELRVQNIATTTAGGFLVPTSLSDQIIKTMAIWGPMYDSAIIGEIKTSAGNPLDIPTVDDTAVAAVAHTEGALLTDDNSADMAVGKRTWSAFAFDTKWVKISMELLQDSVLNVESLLGDLLGERLARIANTRLTTGTGTGQPFGVVAQATNGRTAASATAITGDELIDLVHSVNPAYRQGPKVRFMMHDSTLAAVRKLKDGQGNYLWQMGNVQAGVPQSLLGYPISINNAMATIATTARTVLFGDLGKYYVRKVGDPMIGVVRERFWPDLGIAGVIRFDGRIADQAAIRVLTQA